MGKPDSFAKRLGNFALVGVQLAIILLVVKQYEIEEQRHFFPVLCLAVAGYVVHSCLPPRVRCGFFVLLSLAAIPFMVGWQNGALVIGIGLGLIAICHLPVPLVIRVLLLIIAGAQLAALRVEKPAPFWPVVGSMFMFRLIIYVYETRRERGRPSALTLAYFFALPNACFLFFPIVDFKTMRATYRPEATRALAQTGVAWIVRGLTHLLAYRVVKYFVLPSPGALNDVPHLALFLAANYALYLQVSGMFHIITGIFHLFGFDLPRTHDRYFLASSFTDIWRRINIYWTHFMMKIFFNPAVYALRGWNVNVAVVAGALCVFLATWLLHTYQAFWLTGGLPLSLYEGGLWLIVGVLVAWNLRRDLQHAAQPAEGEPGLTLRGAVGRAARVVGMFVLVSVFWACWNTPGILRAAAEQSAAERRLLAGGVWVLAALIIAVGIGVLAQFAKRWLDGMLPSLTLLARQPGLALVALALLGTPQVASVFGVRSAEAIASLRRESASVAEASRAVQGYYEDLTKVRVPIGSFLAALEGQPTSARTTSYEEMTRAADPMLGRELIPDWHGVIRGRPLSVNRLGMRDRADRTQQKPAGACRIAVVGSSVVMGYGVADDETFPRVLEERFNAGRGEGAPRIEFLNFGTGRSYVIQRRALIERRVFAFEPDTIYYVAHQDEFLGAIRHLSTLVAGRHPLPYPSLTEVVRKAGIQPNTSDGLAEALLTPLAREIVLGTYRELAAESRKRNVRLVWVYVPLPGVMSNEEPPATFIGVAKEAGLAIVNLDGWFSGHTPAQLGLSMTDPHPNALGQRLIAERLEQALRKRPDALPECALR